MCVMYIMYYKKITRLFITLTSNKQSCGEMLSVTDTVFKHFSLLTSITANNVQLLFAAGKDVSSSIPVTSSTLSMTSDNSAPTTPSTPTTSSAPTTPSALRTSSTPATLSASTTPSTPTTPFAQIRAKSDVKLRLADTSNAHAGLLMLQHDGIWSSICSGSWGPAETLVACHQLQRR